MKRCILLLTVALTASALAADDPKPPAAGSATEDLVDAARKSKERRRSSSRKVITNADVKKSKGKIVEREGTTLVVPEGASVTTLQAHEAKLAARKAAEARLAAAGTRVRELETSLRAVEQSYYEEDDLDRRDGEIVRRFQALRAELDEALAEQKAAREVLEPSAAGPVQQAEPPSSR